MLPLFTTKSQANHTPSTHYQSLFLSLLATSKPIRILHYQQKVKPKILLFSMKTRSSSRKLSEYIEKLVRRKKGHFAVYSKEGKRFVVPLYFLNHPIFRVLLEMAEEEFGLTVHGPLKVPCEEELDYILSLLCKNSDQASISSLFLAYNQGGIW